MKKVISFVLGRLKLSCVFFTVIVLIITFAAQLADIGRQFIPADRLVLLFLFSFVLSLICLIFRVSSLGTQIKLMLHWVMTSIALCGLFYFNNMLSHAPQPPSVFIAVLCVTAVAYALGDGMYLLYRVIRPDRGEEKYDPMFRK